MFVGATGSPEDVKLPVCESQLVASYDKQGILRYNSAPRIRRGKDLQFTKKLDEKNIVYAMCF